jgi:hypothetical protein
MMSSVAKDGFDEAVYMNEWPSEEGEDKEEENAVRSLSDFLQ